MREIIYQFNSLGAYQTEQNTVFGSDTHLKLVIEPHEFSIAVGGEVLRNSSCEGFVIDVTEAGAVRICDAENRILASAEGTNRKFRQVEFVWRQELLQLNFGSVQTVDYYPNCDGEHDRWGTEWVTEYAVRFDTASGQISTYFPK